MVEFFVSVNDVSMEMCEKRTKVIRIMCKKYDKVITKTGMNVKDVWGRRKNFSLY